MPTGARLFSAIYVGILTYVVAHMVHAVFELEAGYDLDFGMFKEICAGIGILTGWTVMGSRAGEGNNYAIQGGILTSVMIVFWNLILWSLVEMVQESMKLKYKDPSQAVIDAFRIALEYGQTIGTVPIIGTLLIGGVVGGFVGEWAARRYR